MNATLGVCRLKRNGNEHAFDEDGICHCGTDVYGVLDEYEEFVARIDPERLADELFGLMSGYNGDFDNDGSGAREIRADMVMVAMIRAHLEGKANGA